MLLPLVRSLAGYIFPSPSTVTSQGHTPPIKRSHSLDAKSKCGFPPCSLTSHILARDDWPVTGGPIHPFDECPHCSELSGEMEALRRQVLELSVEVRRSIDVWTRTGSTPARGKRHASSPIVTPISLAHARRKRSHRTSFLLDDLSPQGMLKIRRGSVQVVKLTKRASTSSFSSSSSQSTDTSGGRRRRKPPVAPRTPPLTSDTSSSSGSSSEGPNTPSNASIFSDYSSTSSRSSDSEDPDNGEQHEYPYPSSPSPQSRSQPPLLHPILWNSLNHSRPEESIDSTSRTRWRTDLNDNVVTQYLNDADEEDDVMQLDAHAEDVDPGLDVFGPILFTTNGGR